MTATDEEFDGYLRHIYIDRNQCIINESQKLTLPEGKTKEELAGFLAGWCTEHNIDYVSEDNVRKIYLEAIESEQFRKKRPPDNPDSGEDAHNPSKAHDALDLAKSNCLEFFVDQHGSPYAAAKVKDHVEVLLLTSTRFRNWLCRMYYQKKNQILNGEDVSNALNILKADAEFGGKSRKLHLRVAGDREAIYYDLTNPDWQAVKITARGWEIVESPGIFVRYNNQQAQVYPSRTYDPDIFEKFLNLTNIKTEDGKLLLKCYIVSLLFPDIPIPALMLHGEQGSAKSTLQKLVKTLIDPSSVELLSFPRDISELVQKLSHNRIAYFDNVSHIRDWISDELCKAVTGSGFSKRMLYTNDDDVIYNFRRAIGFNGVNLGATKADLLDRGLIIELQRILDDKRRKEKEIWAEFEHLRSQLLGYIFDVTAKALKLLKEGSIDLKEHPRMADFAEVGEAISLALGNKPDEFLSAYYRNIGLQTQEAVEANPVAQAIGRFMQDKDAWSGSFAGLLDELVQVASNELKIDTNRIKSWPKSPSLLSRRINEVKTNLRQLGIVVETITTSTNTRLVTICKMLPMPPERPIPENQTRIQPEKPGDTFGKTTINPEMPPEDNDQNHAQNNLCGDTEATGCTLHALQCPYCPATFSDMDKAERHGVIQHPGRPFVADLNGGRSN